ncbi:HNH endonuclease [uncultured Methanolobus sp.]|uniref:HNH endonuclease n=1 Tax=uncultured Methanolobus sp. TaxID=218300 RepID=UPI002AAC3BA0|nr:HNH endonuclease [uncultured Methanolobus sp.]
MRPVCKGAIPTDANGNDVEYSDYSNARGELVKRLGEYCSYCEMHLDSSLAVEHVKPKKPKGETEVIVERELDWNNFLLACSNCNSTKGNLDVDLDDYFWPDRDNTLLAFNYCEGGIIVASNILDMNLMGKANATIKLIGLDKNPLNDHTCSDRRWLNRRETWDLAIRLKERLTRNNNEDFRDSIVDLMEAKGYWSIWMTVFKDDSNMLQRFIQALPGTAQECFNEYGALLHRHNGLI